MALIKNVLVQPIESEEYIIGLYTNVYRFICPLDGIYQVELGMAHSHLWVMYIFDDDPSQRVEFPININLIYPIPIPEPGVTPNYGWTSNQNGVQITTMQTSPADQVQVKFTAKKGQRVYFCVGGANDNGDPVIRFHGQHDITYQFVWS